MGFGIGCLGSRLLSGAIDRLRASRLRDAKNVSLDEIREAAGFSGALSDVRLKAGHYAAFIELHIEQGPLFGAGQRAGGLVTAIAALATIRVALEGEGGHAGAVLMPDRRDALTGAAEVILAVEQLARSTGSSDTVATTGIYDVFPGAVNSIPSCVSLALDIRDIDLNRRDRVVARASEAVKAIASRRGLRIESELLNEDAPAQASVIGPTSLHLWHISRTAFGFWRALWPSLLPRQVNTESFSDSASNPQTGASLARSANAGR